MVIGYARVSTDGQDESLQIDALKDTGCERIYVDRASGAIRERPELTNALRDLRDEEDVLVVWRPPGSNRAEPAPRWSISSGISAAARSAFAV